MKTKLTEEKIKELTKFVRAGTYVEMAAKNVGITEVSFYNWMKRGEAATSGIFFDFFKSITRARADVETERVAKIREYGMGGQVVTNRRTVTRQNGDVEVVETFASDWRALAFLLERQGPERWGKRDYLALTDPEGKPLQPFIVVMPDDKPFIYPRGNGHDIEQTKLLKVGKTPPDANPN